MASKYMVEAMQEGDTAAEEEYYRYLYYGYNFKQDREAAVRKWEELDQAGDLLAPVYLADHYMQTVSWDKEKSIKYCQYGKVLTDGSSPFCNEFVGMKCLRIACDSGCGEAFYVLGKLHETGFGVVKDKALAAKMFSQASEHGYSPEK